MLTRDRAFWNVIYEWLRARSACMLFGITWGRWSCNINMSLLPHPVSYLFFGLIGMFPLVIPCKDISWGFKLQVAKLKNYKEANETWPRRLFYRGTVTLCHFNYFVMCTSKWLSCPCICAKYMLIFQLHHPHVIPNSMQALCALSHSVCLSYKTHTECCRTIKIL